MCIRACVGIIDVGHLYGCPAIVIDMEDGGSPIGTNALSKIIRRDRHIHFRILPTGTVGDRLAVEATFLSQVLRDAGFDSQSIEVRPGVTVPPSPLSSQSVLKVTDEDFSRLCLTSLDYRVSSASVHFWPGSGFLSAIDRVCPLPLGRFLVISPDNDGFGEAKIWIADNPRWRLIPYTDYTSITKPEFEEMIPRG